MAAPTCTQCEGRALLGGRCLGHLGPEELSIVAGQARAGKPLDARNAEVSQAALARFLAAIKRSGGEMEISKVDFGGATFTGVADFSEVVFTGEARFSDATFEAARFDAATFRAGARFRDAKFARKTYFRGARFEEGGYFAGVLFGNDVKFERAAVAGAASFTGAHFAGNAFFRNATFHGSAKFEKAAFNGNAKFEHVRFEGHAEFRQATFAGDSFYSMAVFGKMATFEQVRFSSSAMFRKAEFAGTARFHRASFSTAHFVRCHFREAAMFDNSTFEKAANFNQSLFDQAAGFRSTNFRSSGTFSSSTFTREAIFEDARFSANARLADVKFEGETRFRGMWCEEGAIFRRAAFKESREFGLLRADRIDFDSAVFEEHVRVEVSAGLFSAVGTTFANGIQLRVDQADIVLNDADFVRQSTLLGLRSRPRLLSLRGAQVAPLALSSLDLRLCRFFGAHGLDSLEVEASCLWPTSPDAWRMTQRETIAEEHRWRDQHGRDGKLGHALGKLGLQRPVRWQDDEMQRSMASDRPLTPNQIANLYRSLRKAREDGKDAAGAGDLYYGEMEMRRHAETIAPEPGGRRNQGERAILTAYWIASGYGLRAIRAIACLLVVLLAGGGLLFWFGFCDQTYDYGRSLIFAAESSLSLLRPPDACLSPAGEVVQIFLRLLGPLFFGLALLAMRARVKR